MYEIRKYIIFHNFSIYELHMYRRTSGSPFYLQLYGGPQGPQYTTMSRETSGSLVIVHVYMWGLQPCIGGPQGP